MVDTRLMLKAGAILLVALGAFEPCCSPRAGGQLVTPSARRGTQAVPGRIVGDAGELPEPTTLPRPRMLWRRSGKDLVVPMMQAHAKDLLATDGRNVVLVGASAAVFDARTGREARARADGGSTATSIRLVVKGDSVTALGDASSVPLWNESGIAEEGRPYIEPVITPNGVLLVGKEEITRRDAESGRIEHRWPLPEYLRKYVLARTMKVVADGHHFALLTKVGLAMPAVMAIGVDTSSAVAVLERPMVVGNEQVMVGGVLVFYNTHDGVIGAYDAEVEDVALASMDGEAALAAVRAETVGEERMICDRLERLPNLDEHWLRVLGNPTDPLLVCALGRLEVAPQPRTTKILREMAEKPPRGSEGEEMLVPIVRAVVADDGAETSKWLVGFIGRANHEVVTEVWKRQQRSETIGLAWQQLWRTGRTSELGLCPRAPRRRHIDDLDRRASDGSIGTAHPILFQGMAPDGHWALVCQAREDTDEDGRLEVGVGRHGDLLGDEVSPYLIVESGPGWTFDELVGTDPAGRYVAVREGACLTVVDTQSRQATTLPSADLRDDGRVGPHRGVAFDASGSRMLYLRGGAKASLVVRELSTGAERVLDSGPGLVWSARFDPEGHGLEVTTIPSGKWPLFASTLARRRCRGPVSSFSMFGGAMPGQVARHVPLDGSAAVESNDVGGAAPKPPVAVARIRLIRDWKAQEDGLFAERSDGALLRVDRKAKDSFLLPSGPLFWRRSKP